MPPFVALTGVPGTGKSSVAREPALRSRVVELAELALATGSGRRSGRGVEIDLPRLGRWVRAHRADPATSLLVGHLAHRLPVRDTILLRCHPVELFYRLSRARRGGDRAIAENVEAEATDSILIEALRLHRRVWEIDTTGRSPSDVAREVGRIVRERRRPRHGVVDWLADPIVTDYLLPVLR